jgi:dihydroorotate dehydrogenase
MFDLYKLAGPLIRAIDPEDAHGLAIKALKTGLVPACHCEKDPPSLQVKLWGRSFANPIGMAAGFDKNAEVPDALLRLGFGFVEVGSITPRPQSGNPRPRLFRLIEDRAVINRMGFNNEGMEAARSRLEGRKAGQGVVGVNLGKNKETLDAAADYELGVTALGSLADYLVINVSSPNTPGLRALQSREALDGLVARVRAARDKLEKGHRPPLLLKVAPDLLPEDRRDIAQVALARGLDGLIVSNTTIARPGDLVSGHRKETGGLSGRPVFKPSTEVLADFYRLLEQRLPLIGVGGVASGADAYAKIRAGASLVQLYTALIYEGPALVGRIKRDLAKLLAKDGFASVSEAVGADHK